MTYVEVKYTIISYLANIELLYYQGKFIIK